MASGGHHPHSSDDFQEQLEQLEAKQKQERKKLIAPYNDAVKKARKKVRDAQAELDRLEGLRESMFGVRRTSAAAAPKQPSKGGGKKKRHRMNDEQQATAADAIAKLVKSSGDDGMSRGQLEEKVSPFPAKIGAALTDFVNKKNTLGVKIKMSGKKAKARYFAA